MEPAGQILLRNVHDHSQELTRASCKKKSQGPFEIFQGHFQKSGYFRDNFRGLFQFRDFSGFSGISGVAGHPDKVLKYFIEDENK